MVLNVEALSPAVTCRRKERQKKKRNEKRNRVIARRRKQQSLFSEPGKRHCTGYSTIVPTALAML